MKIVSRIALAVFLPVCILSNARAQDAGASMVDPFTGTFNYSIPVITIPGMVGADPSIQLQYNSDITPEMDASWVGYGWGLNIPSIFRQRKGLPDDYNGADIVFNHTIPAKETYSVKALMNPELLKFDFETIGASKLTGGLGTDLTLVYDTDKGLSFSAGLNLKATYGDFAAGAGYNSDGIGYFGVNWRPAFAEIDNIFNNNNLGVTALFAPRRTPSLFSNSFIRVYSEIMSVQTTYKVGGNEEPSSETGLSVMVSKTSFGGRTIQGYGYLHMKEAIEKNSADLLLDYSTEKSSILDATDRAQSPVPYADADIFNVVSAPGISGSFRAYSRFPMEFFPPDLNIAPTVGSYHAEPMASPSGSVGFGSSWSLYGRSENSIGAVDGTYPSWKQIREENATVPAKPFIFRYTEDPAGEIRYSTKTTPVNGTLGSGMSMGDYYPMNRDRYPRSTRNVRFYTHKDLGNTVVPGTPNVPPPDALAAFEITGTDGVRYYFGEPNYVWKGSSTSHVLRNEDRSANPVFRTYNGASGRDPETYYPETHKLVENTAWSDSWLITAAYSPDYVDVTGNGPTDDDLGQWTKYEWTTIAREFDTRTPYLGYLYDKNVQEDPFDDIIQCSRTTREIKVLKSIETKTHKATFYTNKDNPTAHPARLDMYPAQPEATAQLYSRTKVTSNPSVYLTHVDLKKKIAGPSTIAVMTTYMQYDYSVANGSPSNPSSTPGKGKLTLRKVWSEPTNVRDAAIAPYELYYTTPTLGSTTTSTTIAATGLSTRYPTAFSGMTSALTGENPFFDEDAIDAWGYYGAIKGPSITFGGASIRLPYDATPIQTSTAGGPAPYLLKRIDRPGGAITVIRYEPRTYSYVQDSNAMHMRTLDPAVANQDGWNKAEYSISLSDLTAAQRNDMLAECKRRFVDGKERLYCRLLYQYQVPQFPGLTVRKTAGFVRVYAKVNQCVLSGNNLVFTLGNGVAATSTPSTVADYKAVRKDIPWNAALEAYRNLVAKEYKPNLSGTLVDIGRGIFSLLVSGGGHPFKGEGDVLVGGDLPVLVPAGSSIRLPSVTPKRGGGFRVGKLLVVSPENSLEAGDATAVGSVYTYNVSDETGARSSGVATQEPPAMRDQMGIVQLDAQRIPRLSDGSIASELDILRAEGPLGESLLPGASIGYHRRAAYSINESGANTGVLIHRFATVKDVPTIRCLSTPRVERRWSTPEVLGLLIKYSDATIDVEQNHAFHVRNHHGLPLSIEHYAKKGSSLSPANMALLSATRYTYLPPESDVLLFDTINRPLRYGNPGLTMDISSERRTQKSFFMDISLQWGVSFKPGVPWPVFGFAPAFTHDRTVFKQYVTSKITRFPARLQSITTVTDGMSSTIEHMAYDRLTGQSALTQATDGYNGLALSTPSITHNGKVLQLATPALHAYPELGHLNVSDGLVLYGPSGSTQRSNPTFGKLTIATTSNSLTLTLGETSPEFSTIVRSELRKRFTIGDTIKAGASSVAGRGVVTGISEPSSGVVKLDMAWTVSAPSSPMELTIVRSARQNQISAPLSSMALYGYDLKAAVDHAKLLKEREQWTDFLNDAVRQQIGDVGTRWARPFVRYTISGGLPTNEETISYADFTAVPTSPCSPSTSAMNFRLRMSGTPSVPTLGYVRHQPSGGNCVTTDESGYQCTLSTWNRARLFAVNDAGDLTVSTCPNGAVDTRPSELIYGFRLETGWPSTPSWDKPATYAVANVPTVPNLNTVLSAGGTTYENVPRQVSALPAQPLARLRPKGVFTPSRRAVIAGVGMGTERSWNKAGTFTLTNAFDPVTAASDPEWYVQQQFTGWDGHGNMTEAVNASGITSTIRYRADGVLPVAAVTGARGPQFWTEDFELGAGTSTITSHSGQYRSAATSSYAPTLSTALPVLTGGENYVLQAWVQTTCGTAPAIAISVNGSSVAATSTGLQPTISVDGWSLYEVQASGPVTSFAIAPESPTPCATLYIDDVAIRPEMSVLTTASYDDYDRPLSALGDDRLTTTFVYDDRGIHNRTRIEGIAGTHVVMDNAINVKRRPRTINEKQGGVPTSIGLMMGSAASFDLDKYLTPLPKQAFPWLDPDAGKVSMKENLLDATITPEKKTINVLDKPVEQP